MKTFRILLNKFSLYRIVRQLLRVGLKRSFIWRWRLHRIFTAPPTVIRPWGDSSAGCEVHILTCASDWVMAMWAAWSFYHHSSVDWPLVIHDGGGLDYRIVHKIKRFFPNARIVFNREAEIVVSQSLFEMGYVNLIRARKDHVLLRKIVDFSLFTACQKYLCLDSDVLFFKKPIELLSLSENVEAPFCFLRDSHSSYSISSAQAESWFGLKLPEKLNTGVCLVPLCRMDLRFLDEAFLPGKIPSTGNHFPEQTALALLAARSGLAHCLPTEYSVATGTPPLDLHSISSVARHYVGPVRYLFFDEGLPALIGSISQRMIS